MLITEFKNKEGLSLYSCEWDVDQPKAVIILVHGAGEHIGRYAHVAEWFNREGIAVTGFDAQGYGQSAGQPGHVKNFDAYLDDIGQYINIVFRKYKSTPIFLYGHSMGGNITLNYVLRRRPNIQGLIATGPWVRLAFQPGFLKVFMGKLLRNIKPTLSLPTDLVAQYISRDEKVVRAYLNDPLVHSKMSAAGGIDLLEAAAWLNSFGGEVPCPFLIMHGEADKLTSMPASKELAQRLQGDVEYKSWPQLYHEIHNEPEKEAVFQHIHAWIKARIMQNEPSITTPT